MGIMEKALIIVVWHVQYSIPYVATVASNDPFSFREKNADFTFLSVTERNNAIYLLRLRNCVLYR